MPFSQELGMRVYDPNEGAQRGLQRAQLGIDRQKLAMAQQEAALRRQMHMERAVALEAMNKEIRESMAADPKLTDEEARIKVFPKYAGDILGTEYGSWMANAPYRQAQLESTKALTDLRKSELGGQKYTGTAASLQGLRELQRKAELSGDVAGAKIFQAAIDKATSIPGQVIEYTTPDGGKVRVATGGAAGKGPTDMSIPTSANLTRHQQTIENAWGAVQKGSELADLMDNETMGVQAAVERVMNDRFLSQWMPEVASGKRAKAVEIGQEYRAAMIRDLKTDGNISLKEVNEIGKAIPDIAAPDDSAINAKRTILAGVKSKAISAIRSSQITQQAIPPWAANVLDDEDIARLSEEKFFTPDQAIAVYNAKHGIQSKPLVLPKAATMVPIPGPLGQPVE